MDEAVALTFTRYQQVSLELKVDEAKKVIAWSTTQALAIGAVGYPPFDAIPLTGIQLRMLGRISALMGFDVDARAFLSAVAGIVALGQTARVAAGILRWLVPGAGSIANAGVAATTTKALGNTYLKSCSNIMRRKIDGEFVDESAVASELVKEFKRVSGLA